MNELFEKGAILNMAEMVEYSAGGVISKQVLKIMQETLSKFHEPE